MFGILMWVIYGLIVGSIAKAIHPGTDPVGYAPTIAIGVAGSFVGGGINWLLNGASSPFSPAGIVMGIVGGLIACAIWRWWDLRTSSQGPKSFFTGKPR